MIQSVRKSGFDDIGIDEQTMQDTSMFNADEIVKNLEARRNKTDAIDARSDSRKRFEALQEEKRLRADLKDLDDYELGE